MKKTLAILFLALSISGCEKDGNNSDTAVQPGIASMVAPANNELCTSGLNISSTQSVILFQWKKSENTDTYEVRVKNLATAQATVYSTAKKEIEITLSRNTPYSWYIVSKSNKSSKTAQSPVWKFYNSGLGTVSYAPFPAEILAPVLAQNVTAAGGRVTLDWNGADVDGDISGYDVYFSTNASPGLFQSNIKESILTDVPVNSGTTYYWKIITKDLQGNTSDSGVYWFKVN